jgi:hypothetical protein
MPSDENKLIDVAQVGADGVTIFFSDFEAETQASVTVSPAFLPPRVRAGESLALVRRATNRHQFTEEARALIEGWRTQVAPMTLILNDKHADDIAGLLDVYVRQLPTILRQAVFVYAQNAGTRAADRLLEGQGVEKTTDDRTRLLAMQVGDIERFAAGSSPAMTQGVILQLIAEALELFVALDEAARQRQQQPQSGV